MYTNIFRKKESNAGKNFASMLFGAAIGAGAMALSQKQNRDKLNDVVKDVQRRSMKAIDSFKDEPEEAIDTQGVEEPKTTPVKKAR